MSYGDKIASIVISKAGHDKDEAMILLGTDEKGFLLLADGKRRTVESPKRKNPKHAKILKYRCDTIEKILLSGNLPENALIQKELKVYLKDGTF